MVKNIKKEKKVFSHDFIKKMTRELTGTRSILLVKKEIKIKQYKMSEIFYKE